MKIKKKRKELLIVFNELDEETKNIKYYLKKQNIFIFILVKNCVITKLKKEIIIKKLN